MEPARTLSPAFGWLASRIACAAPGRGERARASPPARTARRERKRIGTNGNSPRVEGRARLTRRDGRVHVTPCGDPIGATPWGAGGVGPAIDGGGRIELSADLSITGPKTTHEPPTARPPR